MPPVDDEELADTYDPCRALPTEIASVWVDLLINRLGLDSSARLLDVGRGTGLFAALLSGASGCQVAGGDLTLLVAVKEPPPRGSGSYHWTIQTTHPPIAVPAVSCYNAGGEIPDPRQDQLPR